MKKSIEEATGAKIDDFYNIHFMNIFGISFGDEITIHGKKRDVKKAVSQIQELYIDLVRGLHQP